MLLYLHLISPATEMTCEDFFKDIHRLNRDFELIEAQCNPGGPTLIYRHVITSSSFGIDSPGMCALIIKYKVPKIQMIFLDAFEHELFRQTTFVDDCIFESGLMVNLEAQYKLQSSLAALEAFANSRKRCTYHPPLNSAPYKAVPRG